jgi:hypothetical protein
MSNPDFQSGPTSQSSESSSGQNVRDAAREAFAKVSEAARDTGAKAKQAASETAFTMTEQVKELLDRQLGTGWTVAGQFASSVKRAADDLEGSSPVVAGLVRNFAGRAEEYAEEMQDQTVEQVMRTASDFTRRQPALVFGLAALAGFFMLRTMKSARVVSSPPIQPVQPAQDAASYG